MRLAGYHANWVNSAAAARMSGTQHMWCALCSGGKTAYAARIALAHMTIREQT